MKNLFILLAIVALCSCKKNDVAPAVKQGTFSFEYKLSSTTNQPTMNVSMSFGYLSNGGKTTNYDPAVYFTVPGTTIDFKFDTLVKADVVQIQVKPKSSGYSSNNATVILKYNDNELFNNLVDGSSISSSAGWYKDINF